MLGVKLKPLKRIALDEIAVRKGHKYLTLVMDLDSGRVVYVGDGRGVRSLDGFWRRLKASGAKVEAVATDMLPAYLEAVASNLPKAALVFDRFHIMKLFNQKLSDLRRDLYREATDKLQKKVLKGTRWLLLKNDENLDEDRNERARLEEALDLNRSLATAYYRKEELRELWGQPGRNSAARFLRDWCARARASGIRHPHADPVRQDPTSPPQWHPGPVRPPHLHRASGRDQQQNQNPQTPSLRIPKPRLLQTQNPSHSQVSIRFSRMNHKLGVLEHS